MEDTKRKDLVDGILNQPQEEESSFDFRTIFTLVILNWQWFLLSLFVFICGALLYLRYTAPVFQTSVKMLIKDENNNRRSNGQLLANMQDFGIISNSAGFENEIEILRSSILAREVVKDLKLYTEYESEGRIKRTLIYKNQPINVDLDPESLERLDKTRGSINLKLEKEGNTYRVEDVNGEFAGSFKSLPASINTPYGTLTFTKNPIVEENEKEARLLILRRGSKIDTSAKKDEEYTMYVTITSPVRVATKYAGALNVAPTSKVTSIAELSINDLIPERGIDYLKHLAVCYNRQANADKNEIAYKTETFINKRLEKINAELGTTESELEHYKRSNNLVQLRLDATQIMTQSNLYYGQLSEANTQIQLLDYLREYMDDKSNRYQIIPSNVGLTDRVSSSLIDQYNKVVLDRNRLLAAANENAPNVITLTNTLDQLQKSIDDALIQARRTADIERMGIQKRYDTFQNKVENTPEQERVLTQIGRQQEVMSGLYLLLLQKREENSISLAATADKGRLIDDPAFGGKVSPKSSIILLGALLLGFALPLLIVYVLQLLRYKIEGHEDVAKLTNIPIIADVAVATESVKTAAGIVVHENTNNQTDEIFRSMRTNINFMMKEDQKVIMFTSSTSGEGKTFNAANLAVSFALLGKKVILLGLDIRKPALGRLFDIRDRERGITTLLSKQNISDSDLKEQIMSSRINTNLDVLLAGPTPPNPTELLARENLGIIMDRLKQEYDYIILDTAPVGLVTDTLQIGKYADVTIYLCRADYTPKSAFENINALNRDGKLPNMCLVINGVDMSKKKYGYYYGYGKYGRYARYGRYGNYGGYGAYGNYSESHYGKADDNSIKR